jgi:pimeloyl-ACP methyl ester carboxylesterase
VALGDRPVRALAAAAIGLGLTALAGGTAVRVAGRRVRRSNDPDMDRYLGEPDGVTHHDLLTTDGALLHVAEAGSGTPVVLLHGVGLQWWVWAAQFRLLEGRHRVVAWDMRGHGRSTVGADGVTLDAVADDLVVVLRELDLHDAVLVGHSMGGMALARFCATHHSVLAERVRGLLFLATSAAMIDAESLVGALVGLANIASRLTGDGARLRYGWKDTDLSALLVRGAFGRRASGAAVDDVRRMMSELAPEVAAAAGRSIAAHDVRAELSHVDVPTTVVVGSADRLTSVAHARVIAAEIRGAQLVVLDGVGHQVMQEAPEQLDAVIEDLAAGAAGTP